MEKEYFADSNGVEIILLLEDKKLWQGDRKFIEKSLFYFADALMDFKSNKLNLVERLVLNITLCDESRIKELNHEHRGKNKVTDVLSFPLQDNIRGGIYDAFEGEMEVGDIIICSEVCAKQAQEFNLTFLEEFFHLATHGFLHLCGYDHEISEAEEVIMESFEELILLKFKELRKE